MTAVILLAELGEEEHEEVAQESGPGETTPTTETTETESTETETSQTTVTGTSGTTEATETTETTEGAGDPVAGKEVFLACRRLRELPHARRRRGDRHGRPEPRCGLTFLRRGGRAGDERRGGDAPVQRHADRAADPGRRRVRLLCRRGLTPVRAIRDQGHTFHGASSLSQSCCNSSLSRNVSMHCQKDVCW